MFKICILTLTQERQGHLLEVCTKCGCREYLAENVSCGITTGKLAHTGVCGSMSDGPADPEDSTCCGVFVGKAAAVVGEALTLRFPRNFANKSGIIQSLL